MLFPKNIEEKIGFDKIRDQIKAYCKSGYGKKYVDKIEFTSDIALIDKLLRQTRQMMDLMNAGEELPVLHENLSDEVFKRIRVEGAFLEPDELFNIALVIKRLEDWMKFLDQKKEYAPDLHRLAEGLTSNTGLADQILSKIDEKYQVRDHASRELKSIRSSIIEKQLLARRSLEKIVRSAQQSSQSPEDSTLTVRNGRLVIPIHAEYKRTFRGFIHDESASGRLAYIEPAEILEINNTVKELQYRERREIINILTELTGLLKPERRSLLLGIRFLAKMDFITAKAKYAMHSVASTPELEAGSMLKWYNARHPLLQQSLHQHDRKIVPLNIEVHPEQKILVISGPNAGGKSVCLKTVCLLQYMLQSGMPIPVSEGSVSGVFDQIFIDIGDEQSIESDLSTYSSHLTNMVHLIRHCNKRTLFLIDEFGSGTDPLFGGAIAEAILQKLHQSGAMGLVTTHYHSLKKFAEVNKDVVNGRMRFDIKKLEPLYQLEIGKPGSSFALEIARKIGLDASILSEAREKIGVDQIELDQLLNDLEIEKKNFETKNRALEEKDRMLKMVLKNYEDLKRQLENDKRKIIDKARSQAVEIIRDTNKRTENLIRQIKEKHAAKKTTKRLRDELKAHGEQLKKDIVEKPEHAMTKVIEGEIAVGDYVRIKGQDSVGEVMSLKGKEALVAYGTLKTKIKTQKLEKLSPDSRSSDHSRNETKTGHSFDMHRRKADFHTEIDLRGRRAEAALSELISFVDNAIMFGLPSVRIIHGKGDGILREVIRKELNSYHSVRELHDEHADRGGDGVTIVEFQ